MMAAAPAQVTRRPSSDTVEACNPAGQTLALGNQYLMKYYNPDDTRWVSIDPFRTALTEKMGKCCGIYCPPSSFGSWRLSRNCDAVIQEVFPDQTGAETSGRFGRLEGGDFVSNLLAADDTTLLPLCRPAGAISIVEAIESGAGVASSVQTDADDAGEGSEGEYGTDVEEPSYQLSGAADKNASLLLISGNGEARVIVAQDSSVVGPNPTFYKPAGASPGLRLHEESAKQLAVFRDAYGSRTSTEADGAIYLTIHVPETDEHPGGVFIYSSNTVFLSLSPSFLAVIGGFALLPRTEQLLAHFVSDDCDGNTYNPATGAKWSKDDLRYEERLAQVHAALIRALTPDMQLSIKGKLVRLPSQAENTELCKERHTLAFNGTSQEYVTLKNGDHVLQNESRKWKRNVRACQSTALFYPQFQALHPDLKVSLDGTVDCIDDGFNAALGDRGGDSDCQNGIFTAETNYEGQNRLAMSVLAFSLVVSACIGTFVMHLVISKSKEKLRKRYSEFEVSFKLGIRNSHPPSENITKSKYFMPLEMPVELFQVVVPYRSMFIDSLKRFFRKRYRVLCPTDLSEQQRTCFSVRGYKNNQFGSKEYAKAGHSRGSVSAQSLRVAEIHEQREQSTHDAEATELRHYRMQGIPLTTFKQRYHRFCLDEQYSEVTDAMEVREFLMMKETDPGVTDPHESSGFKICVRKQRTLKGLKIDATALEQFEGLADDDNLRHVLETALAGGNGRLKRATSFIEGVGSCCTNPCGHGDDKHGKSRVVANMDVLDYAIERLRHTKGLHRSSARPSSDDARKQQMQEYAAHNPDTFWSSLVIVLFVAFCSQLKATTKIGKITESRKLKNANATSKLGEQEQPLPKAAAKHQYVASGNAKQSNVTTMADFATSLLDFQALLEVAQIDKAAIKAMFQDGRQDSVQTLDQLDGENAYSDQGDLPAIDEMAPKDVVRILNDVLGIEVGQEQASRKTISNLRLVRTRSCIPYTADIIVLQQYSSNRTKRNVVK